MPACSDDDLHVVFCRQAEEALEPGAGMFRPLPFEAVGQQHDDAAQAVPLLFGTADELVDDDLRDVGEVAELRLPKDQPVGEVQAVAVLEAQDPRFGKRAVVNFNRRLVGSAGFAAGRKCCPSSRRARRHGVG